MFLCIAPFGSAGWIFAQGFPVITRLDNQDMAFRQLNADVEAARKLVYSSDSSVGDASSWPVLAERLTIYRYHPAPGEDLLDLAARCLIPYAALVTLNHLAGSSLERVGTILIPTIPGLYISEDPRTDLEQLVNAGRSGSGVRLLIPREDGSKEACRFIPGDDFTPTERTFFLHPGLFHFPLRTYRITDPYGYRTNPITGVYKLHQGLDLAAPLGTEVYAARAGTVVETGEDAIYGKYIIIEHQVNGDNWVSLYGHLSHIEVGLQSSVGLSTIIGRVGSTGQSTGPHLHFELRQHGKAQDPGKYLF
ncbi:MAG: M23 family metallopeptidase [Treponema sp.]|jgi:murein DD-endopeptidase MepM/ murein hydrolase activator NlpD|nr:M23 family metallopeptidase [Treponema sp.]